MLNPTDAEHRRCHDALHRLNRRLATTWAVLTEAAWLLRSDTRSVERLLNGHSSGVFDVLHLGQHELAALTPLYGRYASLRPQFADLTLLHVAEREGIGTIFTLDRRDFSVFRIGGKRPFQIIP